MDNSGNVNSFLFDGKNTIKAFNVDSVDSWSGTDGNDYFFNTWVDNSTINAGAGNDTIFTDTYNHSINGGDGNDSIVATYCTSKSTIAGGKGNDTINTQSSIIQYADGDGDDVIIDSSKKRRQISRKCRLFCLKYDFG